MYEKYGLMVKITNPDVLAYLRQNTSIPNQQLVEDALREMLNLPIPRRKPRRRTYVKATLKNMNAAPVKISDQFLVDYLVNQKKCYGIMQRHTVETAILRVIERQKNNVKQTS